MSDAFRRVQRHREAKKQLVEIYDKQDKVIVIHYSCESFYDRSGNNFAENYINRGSQPSDRRYGILLDPSTC